VFERSQEPVAGPPPGRSVPRAWSLLLAAILVALATIWVRPGPAVLRGTDAACYARVAGSLARAPLRTWHSPLLDGRRFDEHPPLGLWLEAVWMRAVGATPATAWRWAQLLATLLVAVVSAGTVRLAGARPAALSLLGLAILPGFLAESQNPMLELPLALGLATGFLGAALLSSTRFLGPFLVVAGTAFAVWVKGPPGLATLAALAWAAQDAPRTCRRALVTALLAVVVAAGGLLGLEIWREHVGAGSFLRPYVRDQLLPSMFTGRARPVRAPLYYLDSLARWHLPVLLALALGLLPAVRRRLGPSDRRLLQLGLVLTLTVVLGFSIVVQKNPWYVDAAMVGFAWTCGALADGLVGAWATRWLSPRVVAPLALVGIAWLFTAEPKQREDALYGAFTSQLPVLEGHGPVTIANCSALGDWMARHSFALRWGARVVPCSDEAALLFDGRIVRPVVEP